MWADKSWFGLHKSRCGSSMYINHACIQYVFFLLVCCQACRVNMLWPGETQVVPGNAGISTTVTERWPLTSDWKPVDWPVNQTAANRPIATPFSPTLSPSHNTATLCPPITGYCTPSLTFDYSWSRVLFLLDHSNYSEPGLRQVSQCYPLQAHPGLASSVMNWKSSSGMNSENKAFYWAPYPFPWLLRLQWSCDYLEAHERHWNYYRAQLKIISERQCSVSSKKEAVC